MLIRKNTSKIFPDGHRTRGVSPLSAGAGSRDCRTSASFRHCDGDADDRPKRAGFSRGQPSRVHSEWGGRLTSADTAGMMPSE